MSGKLTLESGGGWKHTVPVTALSILAALAAAWFVATQLRLTGWTLTIAAALTAYVVFRMLYGLLDRALPSTIPIRTADWSLTEDALTLDGQTIPRDTIRQVHCWPNRDALGHSLPGWSVNIETTGRNQLLRSLAEGPLADRSVQQLHDLVDALGYGVRWPE